MYEFSDFLVNVLKITNLGAILDGKAVILDSCTALRNYGVKNELRILLSKVRGLEIVELNGAEVCCGFGGTFSVKFDEVASTLAASKLEQVMKTGAKYIISTDYSCLMHLKGFAVKNGLDIQMLHIADVLASGWD
jgi:L-lactate dehydrogenase complex protein LldE